MFTGLVTDIGRVIAVDKTDGVMADIESCCRDVAEGMSIMHSGICLTVTRPCPRDGGCVWTVSVSPETCRATTAGDWQIGHTLNLERSLTAGSEMGGHMMFGHVDEAVTVTSVHAEGKRSLRVRIALPPRTRGLVVRKGSIGLDGVSLTVAEAGDDWAEVVLIPHTLATTSLAACAAGQLLNLEIDMLARYVQAMIARESP